MLRVRSLLIAAAVALVLPTVAHAATLSPADRCYERREGIRLTGTGFAPDSPIEFTLNGRQLTANVVSDSNGDLVVVYSPPRRPRVRTELRLVFRATDSEGTTARTTVYRTATRKVYADPRGGDIDTWRAVFSLYGFGRGRAYLHYVNPNGTFKKTVRLGRLRGPCGRLRTDKRRVMPFDKPQFGRWKLQFDTRRRFSRDTVRKRVVPVDVYRG